MIGMTVCSGIGAPELSAPWIDWKYQSEIEPFPAAVLAHRFPDAVNLGDMTKFEEWPNATVDVLCGGTPCQSFSIAGLRQGMADPRGNLALTYLAIAQRYRPRWIVWENVPGVLSSLSHDAPDALPPEIDLDGDDGPEDGEEVVVEDEYIADETHALWCFMAGASELGYHGGFRVVDAQYGRTDHFPLAVPQRRRRLFFIGYLGDWRRAAAVLFDGESLSGNPPPRREAGERPAPTISARTKGGGGLGTDFDCDGGLITQPVANPLTARMHKGVNTTMDEGQTMIAHALRGGGFDASEDGTGRGTPIVPVVYRTAGDGAVFEEGDKAAPLTTGTDPSAHLVAFSSKDYGADALEDCSPTLRAGGHDGSHANAGIPPAIAIQERAVNENIEAGPQGSGVRDDGAAYTMEARNNFQAVAFDLNQITNKTNRSQPDPQVHHTLPATSLPPHLASLWAVRRLTPTECHRLMGFPDDWCRIPWRGKPADQCPDGPQYKALGNSWAINCGEWIFDRIKIVEAL